MIQLQLANKFIAPIYYCTNIMRLTLICFHLEFPHHKNRQLRHLHLNAKTPINYELEMPELESFETIESFIESCGLFTMMLLLA